MKIFSKMKELNKILKDNIDEPIENDQLILH